MKSSRNDMATRIILYVPLRHWQGIMYYAAASSLPLQYDGAESADDDDAVGRLFCPQV